MRLCLKSLARILPKTFSYEIIVVDSQSTIETQNVVVEDCAPLFSSISLVPFKENTGYTRGVNEGIKKSKGDYILILNPDIVVLEGAIKKMHQYMVSHSEIGLIGPQLLNFDDTIQQSYFRFYTPLTILYRRIGHLPFAQQILNKFLMRDIDISRPVNADWLMGSALMVSRKSIDKVGLMDEQMFLYMSEVDWARRFWENGFTVVYYPHAQFYHYHKRESKGQFGILDIFFKRETRWHIKDAIRYFRKHGIKPAYRT